MEKPHYEIWGGYCDDDGAEAEFLEHFESEYEARGALSQYRTSNRYAYIRDMNHDGRVLHG